MTLTLMPAAMDSSIAGRPSTVPGILIITLGRSTCCHSQAAISCVPTVSCASVGDTSTDTKPSWPSVASNTGRSTSVAERMSSSTTSQYVSSTLLPAAAHAASCSS